MSSSLTEVSPCPIAYVNEQHWFWQVCADMTARLNLVVRTCYNDSFHMKWLIYIFILQPRDLMARVTWHGYSQIIGSRGKDTRV